MAGLMVGSVGYGGLVSNLSLRVHVLKGLRGCLRALWECLVVLFAVFLIRTAGREGLWDLARAEQVYAS